MGDLLTLIDFTNALLPEYLTRVEHLCLLYIMSAPL